MKVVKFFPRIIIFFGLLLAACAPAPTPLPTLSKTSLPAVTLPTVTPAPTTTPTPSQTPVPVVRFAVIGDYGLAGDDLAAVAALIDSWNVDLIITTGDNNYPDGAAITLDENIGQYFQAYIHPYAGGYGPGAETNRFFPSLGNHDWLTNQARPYLDYFTLPGNERYYDFTWEFVHFFALDSDWPEPDGIGRTSPQAQWLQPTLADSKAPWKIVYFHHAPFSSGLHGGTPHMQWPFEDWGASVVISGHDHHYERLLVDSLPYFVNGLGGGARYPISLPVPGSQARYRARHGAMLVEATPNEITFQFIDVEGEVIDTFTLAKK